MRSGRWRRIATCWRRWARRPASGSRAAMRSTALPGNSRASTPGSAVHGNPSMLREPDLADAAQAAHRASRAAGIAHRLRWLVNRLRCMAPAEIAHRVGRLLAAQAERAGLLHAEPVPDPDAAPSSRSWVHAAPGVDPAPYLAAANRIAAGELQLFALEVQNPRAAPRWNRDPKTGIEAPLGFGKLLDYRDPRRVGDIKYLWELNRHLHL